MPMQLRIVCPEKSVFEGCVAYVSVPTSEGEFGILPRHASEICTIGDGYVRVAIDKMGETDRVFAVADGYAQVANDEVIVLVNHAKDIADVDVEEIAARLQGFEDELGNLSETDARRAYLYNEIAWCKLLLARQSS